MLAEQTFRDTFAAENTAENMDRHCRDSYSPAIQMREILAQDRMTLLAFEAGQAVGFAQLRWCTAPACVDARSPGEIQRIYVRKSWHGRGVAQELMSVCLQEMRRRGSDVVWLGVWERNPRAVSFYQKFNFTAVGMHEFFLGQDRQNDIIMARILAESAE